MISPKHWEGPLQHNYGSCIFWCPEPQVMNAWYIISLTNTQKLQPNVCRAGCACWTPWWGSHSALEICHHVLLWFQMGSYSLQCTHLPLLWFNNSLCLHSKLVYLGTLPRVSCLCQKCVSNFMTMSWCNLIILTTLHETYWLPARALIRLIKPKIALYSEG